MRIIPNLQEPAAVATADPPAGGIAAAPGSLTLSTGLTLPVLPTRLVPRPGLHGLVERLTYQAYDADPALRHSLLNKINVSPLHLFWSVTDGPTESTTDQTLGRVFHTLTLQPELEEETVVVVDASTRSTNIYKAAAARAEGKDVVLRHEYEDLCRMRDRFHAKAINRDLLRGAHCEVSLFWDDPATGIPCKARPDVLSADWMVDVKTCRDLDYFEADARKYGYHRQAAWYAEGAREVTGVDHKSFLFIVVEKSAPFDSKVFRLGPQDLAVARLQNAANLSQFKHCVETNRWPGYPEVVKELKP